MSPMPLVVSEIDGAGDNAAAPAMMASRSGRTSGSPPVKRTSLTPSATARRYDPDQLIG